MKKPYQLTERDREMGVTEESLKAIGRGAYVPTMVTPVNPYPRYILVEYPIAPAALQRHGCTMRFRSDRDVADYSAGDLTNIHSYVEGQYIVTPKGDDVIRTPINLEN